MSLKRVYNILYKHYGEQQWWPADSVFEIMVGAILTQNTAWTNVEKAVANLKSKKLLSPQAIVSSNRQQLAECISPSGYFNQKAERLKIFSGWYLDSGKYSRLNCKQTDELRNELLSIKGIGPETADDILLYAFNRKVFVIDAYTRRIFSRLGLVEAGHAYEELRGFFEKRLAKYDAGLFNEYHALIVNHGKDVCKTRPRCEDCCLSGCCQQRGL